MEISIDRIKKVDACGKVQAFVDVCVDGSLIITGCKIMDSDKGPWLALPSTKGKDDKYYPVIKFVSRDHQDVFQNEVLAVAEGKF